VPKLRFTPRELSDYFSGYKKSTLKDNAMKMEKEFRTHAEGLFPAEIIEQARPHESKEVFEYRKKIWKAKTKPLFNKVFNSLSKIRRSADWAINYPEDIPTRTPEGETLQDYCEEHFPYFTSVTNWTFQVLLREYLIDPNAVCIVIPIEVPELQTDFIKPYPMIINSEHVVDYRQNDYAVLENKLGSEYIDQNGNTYKGKSFFVVTTMEIIRYDQKNSKGDYTIGFLYQHNFGHLPAYKLQAVLIKTAQGDFLYESRLSGMLPELDEAVREYRGTGKLTSPAGQGTLPIKCEKCQGLGYVGSSPFSKLTLRLGGLDQVGGTAIPVPPAGFVEKDVEIVKVQEEGVDKHLYQALAAVNMEFLAEKPLTQSGVAKEVDRDETNNFVHSVAEDIVRIMDWIYFMIAKYRYGIQYPTDEDVKLLLPDIEVPEHFDIFSTKFIEEELKNAKDNKINPVLINAMEISYASKKFIAEEDIRDTLVLVLQLDPMANVTEEDKGLRLQNKGITELDYVISCNIQQFVLRAVNENKGFAKLPVQKQQEILKGYAQEVVDENSAKQEILDAAMEDAAAATEDGAPNAENGKPPVNNNADQYQ
jgi:hypothetical protein